MSEQDMVYRDEDWPHGLRCADCERLFVNGDSFSTPLDSFVDDVPVLLVKCRPCVGLPLSVCCDTEEEKPQ